MKKKSKFLTFLFSLMPGAGHMYLGFMKMGVSIMSCFFAVIFFSAMLSYSPFMLIIPIIWFYSFFDALNKNGLPDDEFYAQEDHFLFHLENIEVLKLNLGKFRLLIAAGLIIIGINLIFQNFMSILYRMLPEQFYYSISSAADMLPEVLLGILIIYVGVKLIAGKNTELKQEEQLQITEIKEDATDENA